MRIKIDEPADVTKTLQILHIVMLLTFVTAMPPTNRDRLRIARPQKQRQKISIGS